MIWKWKNFELDFSQTRVMGILNVTPDSFFDGKKYFDSQCAVAQAWRMQEEGADLIDVGAESSRPGAAPVSEEEELRRLRPVLQSLQKENFPLPISLDSMKSSVVRILFQEGLVDVVNDIGGLRDPEMKNFILEHQIPVMLMHMFGNPQNMQKTYRYQDLMEDLLSFFTEKIKDIPSSHPIMIDPGIGFGKSVEDNLLILNQIHRFQKLGKPVLIGASRKSFIGKVLDLLPEDRLEGSLAVASVMAMRCVSMLRVHDVEATVRSIKMVHSIKNATIASNTP